MALMPEIQPILQRKNQISLLDMYGKKHLKILANFVTFKMSTFVLGTFLVLRQPSKY